jgi:hypothetical protein
VSFVGRDVGSGWWVAGGGCSVGPVSPTASTPDVPVQVYQRVCLYYARSCVSTLCLCAVCAVRLCVVVRATAPYAPPLAAPQRLVSTGLVELAHTYSPRVTHLVVKSKPASRPAVALRRTLKYIQAVVSKACIVRAECTQPLPAARPRLVLAVRRLHPGLPLARFLGLCMCVCVCVSVCVCACMCAHTRSCMKVGGCV